MILHIFDGRILNIEYDILNIQEIIEYDEKWNEDSEPTRKFEIHDKNDSYYWLCENYDPPCRRTSKEVNPVSHGFVLMCGSQVIIKLESEQQGKEIINNIAIELAIINDRVVFLQDDLSITSVSRIKSELEAGSNKVKSC